MADAKQSEKTVRHELPVIGRGRLIALLMFFVVGLTIVGARTIWYESVQNRTLKKYAQAQQQNTQELPAVRGDIVDRNGQELAVGEDAVTFYATPSQISDPAATAIEVAEILKMRRKEKEALVTRLTEADSGFAYVARQIPRDKAQLLQEAEIEGIGWYDEERRLYPLGTVAGQLLGTVDIDNLGIAGIEMLYDSSLRGTPGESIVVRETGGVPIDVLSIQPEVDGRDVQLTIDSRIQNEMERVLAKTVKDQNAKGATGVVLNPTNGEILAMASVPLVNPDRFGESPGFAQKVRAVTDTYEPGSTFKIVPISAAIEDKLTSPTHERIVPFKITVADREIEDSHSHPTEWMTTRDILVESSNVGTIKIGQDLGKERLDSWIRQFGFGSPTGIDFPGEVQGLVPRPEDWSGSTIGNIPIGQGIGVTPIQMVASYAAIANDGVLIEPHLLKRIGDEPEAKHPARRVISAETARIMRNMFEGVVRDEGGTGAKAQIPGYEVAGKTGTANIAEGGVYVKGRYMSSFIGFVPAKNPQLVTLIVMNEPTSYYGGEVAAPAFEQITKFALNLLAIPPDGLM